jgi:predicted GNAT superfamily acetyltransferase
MSVAAPRDDRAGMTDVRIRDARGGELVAGCALLATSLCFAPRDALPPWLIQTAAASGGIALGAFSGAALVGFSAAIPAEPDALFSCGLAVDPAHRGSGIGRRLKLAQRERALASGRTVIRWTAEPLAAAPLGLYLSGLGARLVDYGPGLYDEVRPADVPQDDVTIEWRLTGPPAAAGRAAASVEVPFDHRALDPNELADWRMRVRRRMSRTLERGNLGTGVALDRAARRAWVLFAEAHT